MKKNVCVLLLIFLFLACDSDSPFSDSSSLTGFWRSKDMHYQCYMYYRFDKGGRFVEYEQHPTNGRTAGAGSYKISGDKIEIIYDDAKWNDDWTTRFSLEGKYLIMYDNPNSQTDEMVFIQVNDFVDF